MNISGTSLSFDDDSMRVELTDGRTLGLPLAWFPRLLKASPERRLDCTISHGGLHWEEIDEDISIDGLLAGRGGRARRNPEAA